MIALEFGETFIPHIHKNRLVTRLKTRTIEAWIILNGSVTAYLYDGRKKFIGEAKLNSGDLIITYDGGHNYVAQSSNALVVEVKSGPYNSRFDKERF
jgi:hypothetical protein